MKEEIATRVLSEAIYIGVKKSANYLVLMTLTGYLTMASAGFLMGTFDRDDTDGIDRSNMMLHTDHKTGCQYLSAVNGGLTPRLGPDGKHLGCR